MNSNKINDLVKDIRSGKAKTGKYIVIGKDKLNFIEDIKEVVNEIPEDVKENKVTTATTTEPKKRGRKPKSK